MATTTATTINGKDGTADLTIASQSYQCFLDSFTVTENTEMLTADVFCIEGTADQEPGRSQLTANISGLGKKGAVGAGPLIPAPQNVAMVFTYSTDCTISGTFNFTQATATRTVNQNMRITGTAISKGAYVTSWDVGGP